MNKNMKIKYQTIEAQLVELNNKAPNEDIKEHLRKAIYHLGRAYDGGK